MSRMYSMSFVGVTGTAPIDLFDIIAADDKPILIHQCTISQYSELGDAEEEQLVMALVRGNSTPSSGGSLGTFNKLDNLDSNPGATGTYGNTTVASGGTPEFVYQESFNIRDSWFYQPTPEQRIRVRPGFRVCVRMRSTPTDAVTFSGNIIIEELG